VHVFSADGSYAVTIPHPTEVPESGSYAYAADNEKGYAWFLFHGDINRLALLDVDTACFVDVYDTPLKGVSTSGLVLTPDGFFTALNSYGDCLIFDTRNRCTAHYFDKLQPHGLKGHCLAAHDGKIIVNYTAKDPAVFVIDPRSGTREEFDVLEIREGGRFLGFLSKDRLAVEKGGGIVVLRYPDFKHCGVISMPDGKDGWNMWVEGGGRIIARKSEGDDLFVLGEDDTWQCQVKNFTAIVEGVPDHAWSWTVIPGGILAIGWYGEVCVFEKDGKGRVVRELDNYGYQSIGSFAAAESGSKVYIGPLHKFFDSGTRYYNRCRSQYQGSASYWRSNQLDRAV